MKIVIELVGWATILVLLTFALIKLTTRATGKSASPDFASRLEQQNGLMSELIKACAGDKRTAIRLIERERNLDARLKTLEAIDRALAKLARDRGGYTKNR